MIIQFFIEVNFPLNAFPSSRPLKIGLVVTLFFDTAHMCTTRKMGFRKCFDLNITVSIDVGPLHLCVAFHLNDFLVCVLLKMCARIFLQQCMLPPT